MRARDMVRFVVFFIPWHIFFQPLQTDCVCCVLYSIWTLICNRLWWIYTDMRASMCVPAWFTFLICIKFYLYILSWTIEKYNDQKSPNMSYTFTCAYCVALNMIHVSGIRKFDEHDSQQDYAVSMTILNVRMLIMVIIFRLLVYFGLHAMRYIVPIFCALRNFFRQIFEFPLSSFSFSFICFSFCFICLLSK